MASRLPATLWPMPAADRFGRASDVLLVLAAVCALAAAFAGFFHLVSFPYDLEPGEADEIYYTQRLVQGDSLYSDSRSFPYLFNVHSPALYLLLAPFVAMFGPGLPAARCLCFGSSLLAAWLASRWLGSRGCSRPLRFAAAAALLSAPALFPWEMVCRVDAPALLLGVAWLLHLDSLRNREPGAGDFLLHIGLGLAAFLGKWPTFVVFAGAATCLLFIRNRRRALGWMASCGLACGAAGWAVDLWSGGVFWNAVTEPARWTHSVPWKWLLSRDYLASQGVWLLALAAAALVPAIRSSVPGWAWMGLGLGGIPIVRITIVGVAANSFLPFHVFLISIGILAAHRLGTLSGGWRACASFLVAAQLLSNAWSLRGNVLVDLERPKQAGKALEAALQKVRGPILLDRQTEIWIRAGRPDLYVEVCGLSLRLMHGGLLPEEFIQAIRHKRYGAIVLRRNTLLPVVLQRIIGNFYEAKEAFSLLDDDHILFLPRPGA